MIMPTLYDVKERLQTATLKRGNMIHNNLRVLLEYERGVISFVPDTPCIPQDGDIVVVAGNEYEIMSVLKRCDAYDFLYSYETRFNPPTMYAGCTYTNQTQNFNFQNAVSNSILGSQQNATINVISNISELREKIDAIQDVSDKEKLSELMSEMENLM